MEGINMNEIFSDSRGTQIKYEKTDEDEMPVEYQCIKIKKQNEEINSCIKTEVVENEYEGTEEDVPVENYFIAIKKEDIEERKSYNKMEEIEIKYEETDEEELLVENYDFEINKEENESSRSKKLCELARRSSVLNNTNNELSIETQLHTFTENQNLGKESVHSSSECSQNKIIENDSIILEIPEEVVTDTNIQQGNGCDSESEPEDPFACDHSITDPHYELSTDSDQSSLDNDEVIEEPIINNEVISEPDEPLGNNDTLSENENALDDALDEMWTSMQQGNIVNIIEHHNKLTVNVNYELCKSPFDCYKLFVDQEVMNLIVTETNRYAAQKINTAGNKSKLMAWKETNCEEMYMFFGIVVCMGLVRVSNINQYWSKNALYHNEYISTRMTRDRFLLLLQNIHFNNNENLSTDCLFRIRPLITILNTKFESMLTPARDIVIHKSMVPWRGHLGMGQYNQNKRHKYGVKLYKVCTLDGYTLKVKVYCGKEVDQTNDGNSHTIKVVMNLMQDLLDSGRVLYADNFFSSIPLVKKLKERKTLYCGTLRSNRRGLPKDFISSKIEKNQVKGVCNGNGTKIIKWQDKRIVLMISNKKEHGINLHDTGKKNRTGEPILKPKSVIDYNRAKKGVDVSDQMSSYYTTLRKGLKWYRKVAFELLFGTSVVNAYSIYNEINKYKGLNMLQFREQLAVGLTSYRTENENPNLIPTSSKPKRVHTFKVEDGPGRKKRRNCTGCYKKLRATLSSREADKKVTKISSYCNDCENKPALCLSCFNERHSNIQKK